ncbi:GtrA family protein [Corynebacterium liangguodongii]|uniref:GtrA family protein n=1 Tax=Corynebacterium liangguodongii TaxID=2079535 RepID=UPI001F4810BE|nr:GtrA family protein [Corynebacterium liangguodongii]
MPSQKASLLSQLIPFVIIGVGCAVVDFGITYLLTSPFGRMPAKAIGWCFGTLIAYLLNSKFAFQAKVSAKKAGAVFILYGATFGVQLLLYAVTEPPLAALGFVNPWKDGISFIIAQGVATVTNFALQRRLIFRAETKIVSSAEPRAFKDAENPPAPPSAVA